MLCCRRRQARIMDNKKKKTLKVFSFLVPAAVLFSNTFLEDLEKIWALRECIPDPTKPISPNRSMLASL